MKLWEDGKMSMKDLKQSPPPPTVSHSGKLFFLQLFKCPFSETISKLTFHSQLLQNYFSPLIFFKL